jgi:hypothetical protein
MSERFCWNCGRPCLDDQRWIVWTHVVGAWTVSPLAPLGWPVHIFCGERGIAP